MYTARNDDTTPRTVLIEHPSRKSWKLDEKGAQPEEAASGFYRFRVNVEPKAATTLTLRESQPTYTSYQLTNVDDNQIKLWLRQRSITPEMEAAFRKIVERKNRVAALDDETSMKRDEERQKIYDDQQRLRENLEGAERNGRGNCALGRSGIRNSSRIRKRGLKRCSASQTTWERSRSKHKANWTR